MRDVEQDRAVVGVEVAERGEADEPAGRPARRWRRRPTRATAAGRGRSGRSRRRSWAAASSASGARAPGRVPAPHRGQVLGAMVTQDDPLGPRCGPGSSVAVTARASAMASDATPRDRPPGSLRGSLPRAPDERRRRPMRRWSGDRPRRGPRHAQARRRRSPSSPTTSATLRRRRPRAIAATFLSGRPFPERDQRTDRARLGARIAAAAQAGRRRGRRRPWVRPTIAPRTWAPPSASCSDAAGHRRRPGPAAHARATSPAAFEAARRGRGRRAEAAPSSRALLARCRSAHARGTSRRILSGELRIGLREGHLEAAIAAAFERDARGRPVGRHAHRRHRADRRPGARRRARGRAALALFHPLKSMLASPVADEAEALARMAPPVWVEDKYDGIRAQLHKAGRRGPPLQPRPQRRQRPVPGGRARGRGRCPGTASSTASCWPGRTGRRCPSCSSRRASGARRRPRPSRRDVPGHLRRLRRPRAGGPAASARGRAAAAAAAARAPRPARGARPRPHRPASAWRPSSSAPDADELDASSTRPRRAATRGS